MGHNQTLTVDKLGQDLRAMGQRGLAVWRLVPRRDKLTFGIALLVMLFHAVSKSIIPVVLKMMVNRMDSTAADGLAGSALYPTVGVFLGIISATFLVRELLRVLQRYLVEKTSTRIEKETTVALVSHLLRVDLATLSRERVGALHGRITRSVEGFVKFLKLSFLDSFPALITAIVALVVAIAAQPLLGFIMAGVVPVALWIVIRQLRSQKGIRLELLRGKEQLDGTVVEQLAGIEYVRAANTVQREVQRVERVAESQRVRDLDHHVAMAWFECAKAVNEGFFHILVLSCAIILAVRQQIGYGDILMFSMLFFNVMNPLREVHRILDEAHESSLHVSDLLAMLAEPIDASFGTITLRQPKLTGEVPVILLDNVSMDYMTPDGQRCRGLDRISMTIRHGETIGAAGPAGSGKSTWLKILMRLVHPTEGVALLGGVPLSVLSRESIGQLVGYVSQTPFIVAGTIADNIAYGTEQASPDAIMRAAQLAHIHDEILAMPGGYQAQVAERGQNLSGGQRQRLALARIFLKNPPILILDEGTSALDNINERNIQRAIAEARKDRTVIMVAHRLSTLRPADRIFVFQNGHIVETGPYDALLQQQGVFAELVHSGGDSPELPHHGAARLPCLSGQKASRLHLTV